MSIRNKVMASKTSLGLSVRKFRASKISRAAEYLVLVGGSPVSVIGGGAVTGLNLNGADTFNQVFVSPGKPVDMGSTSLIAAIAATVTSLGDGIVLSVGYPSVNLRFEAGNLASARGLTALPVTRSSSVPSPPINIEHTYLIGYDSITNIISVYINGVLLAGNGIPAEITGLLTLSECQVAVTTEAEVASWHGLHVIAKKGGLPSNMAAIAAAYHAAPNSQLSAELLF